MPGRWLRMLLVAAAVVVVLGAAYVAVIRPLSTIAPQEAPAPSEPGAGPHRPQAGATASASAAAPGATGQPPQGGPSGVAMPTGDLPGQPFTLSIVPEPSLSLLLVAGLALIASAPAFRRRQ